MSLEPLQFGLGDVIEVEDRGKLRTVLVQFRDEKRIWYRDLSRAVWHQCDELCSQLGHPAVLNLWSCDLAQFRRLIAPFEEVMETWFKSRS